MLDFARLNELFVAMPEENLSFNEHDVLPLQEVGVDGFPILDTNHESLRRHLLRGADLAGWRVTRLGNIVFLTAETGGRLLPGLQYRILVKTPEGWTYVYQLKSSRVTEAFHSYTAQVDLGEIGNPRAIGFSADVRQGAVLDSTGWSLIILDHTPGYFPGE